VLWWFQSIFKTAVLQQDAQLIFFWILRVYMHKVQMHEIYFCSIGHHSENSYSFYTTRVLYGALFIYFFKMHECSLMQDYFCYVYALPI